MQYCVDDVAGHPLEPLEYIIILLPGTIVV